ncbi:pectate lyase [Lewinella sp. LCG006]|uniref:pectate lyase n=1 Tax=Lewinella sp. LCG006 TaxID=3231911 RepID=UPI00346157D8
MKQLLTLVFTIIICTCNAQQINQSSIDETAEKMLLYQRANGGWPQYKGDATDYSKEITAELSVKLIADKERLDATLDDRSTTAEIKYLLAAHQRTNNPAYLAAAEKGIAYLLMAQNTAGGWPQSYPDTSNYHGHITYNDNAMIDVMWIIKGLAEDDERYQAVAPPLRASAKEAFPKGIQCILNTQVVQEGQLTVWCAQHDRHTLQPAPARKFEPASLSGSESVGITYLLMAIDQPSPEIKRAVRAAVAWFEALKIEGWNVEIRKDPNQPSGRDRVVFEEEGSTIWARFYELNTFKPIFTGRDGISHYQLEEIENERRVGYGFYGKWPQNLLRKAYPVWEEKWD